MILLIRFGLISLIVYLIIRSFRRIGEESENKSRNPEPEKESRKTVKGVSKEIGEYVDYEEVD